LFNPVNQKDATPVLKAFGSEDGSADIDEEEKSPADALPNSSDLN
jgi:hypothetical protein